jgi:hypothetical protein
MGATVQARLDPKAQAALKTLIRTNGWTTSQALRECVLRVYEQSAAKPRPRLIGIGCFDSGVGDLATNKEHMRDFGVKSMGKGWQRPEERSSKRKSRTK